MILLGIVLLPVMEKGILIVMILVFPRRHTSQHSSLLLLGLDIFFKFHPIILALSHPRLISPIIHTLSCPCPHLVPSIVLAALASSPMPHLFPLSMAHHKSSSHLTTSPAFDPFPRLERVEEGTERGRVSSQPGLSSVQHHQKKKKEKYKKTPVLRQVFLHPDFFIIFLDRQSMWFLSYRLPSAYNCLSLCKCQGSSPALPYWTQVGVNLHH